jgi:hypothetical protein
MNTWDDDKDYVMKISLIDTDYAYVSFADQAKVSIRSKEGREYNVRWYKREKISDKYAEVGRMDLQNSRWGAYPIRDIEEWKIELWQGDDMVRIFDNRLSNNPVILIAKAKAGKTPDFEQIKKYCSDKVSEFNCKLFVYFENSQQFDFSGLSFQPLRMNDDIPNMYCGVEKEF